LEILGELLRHNKSDAAMRHLTTTQQLVRDGLNDARQSIWALRSQDASESTLPVRLRRLVEQGNDTSLNAEFAIHGIYRSLSNDIEQEILRIAQEAIANVRHHANASRLDVRLDYDRERVTLTFADNGKGFDLEKPKGSGSPLRAAGVTGHYGLIGMQERAALIHGELSIQSQPSEGTIIRLEVKSDASAGDKNVSSDATAVS
jgi:signal transduction histidine kinase